MIKPPTIDLSATNIANLGGDLEKSVREAAAANEEQWSDAGKAEGLQVWRIEKFQVVDWPKEYYGKFYSGDSYIVLNTYTKNDKLMWDVHFWLGRYATTDEIGTAAYKTVELDDILGGAPVQHREVQDYESDLFESYFNNQLMVLDGGVESGFDHVTPEEYKPRLLHVKGHRKNVNVRQVNLSGESLNSGDVFILDNGLTVYQWSGSSAGIFEKNKAAQVTRALDDERKGQVNIVVLNEGDEEDAFWELVGGKVDIAPASAGGDDKAQNQKKRLFKLSDADGSLDMEEVAFSKDSLTSEDVFILDAVSEIFAWVGSAASVGEKKNSMHYAFDYLKQQSDRSEYLPIVRIFEGGENESFEACFA